MREEDTIAAIATAPGEGSVAIVRISGSQCYRIADTIFRCAPPAPSARAAGTFVHGQVKDGEVVIDDGLLLLMRAPHSYTGEDTVEIHGHGGQVSARRVLKSALDAGARLAEPGEFTKRAFLNGKIDLTQAEAINDLIRARSDRAAEAAIEQLNGRITNYVTDVYDKLVGVSADLEATLDFPEDELPQYVATEIITKIVAAKSMLSSLLASWGEGVQLREGVVAVISGKPNVGKSTLMNMLLGSDRVIVSHIPGTTRDAIEETLLIGGVAVRLVDTAGLRRTDDAVEMEGIRRSNLWRNRAHIHIYMIDGSVALSDDDREQIEKLDRATSLLVANKMDLGRKAEIGEFDSMSVRVCLKDGAAREIVLQALSRIIMGVHHAYPYGNATISERHKQLIESSAEELDAALGALKSEGALDATIAADHVRNSLECMAQITGKSYQESLLDAIFSRFCIGK